LRLGVAPISGAERAYGGAGSTANKNIRFDFYKRVRAFDFYCVAPPFLITVYVLPINKYNNVAPIKEKSSIGLRPARRLLKIRDSLSLERGKHLITTLKPKLNTLKVAGSSFVNTKENLTKEELTTTSFTPSVNSYLYKRNKNRRR